MVCSSSLKKQYGATTFNFLKLHLKSHFSWWYYNMSIIFRSFAILNKGLFTSLNVPQKISKIRQKINLRKPINDKKYSKFSHFSNTQQALLIIKDAFIVSKSQSTPSRHYHLTFVITCNLMMRPVNLRTCCQERELSRDQAVLLSSNFPGGNILEAIFQGIVFWRRGHGGSNVLRTI